MEILKDSAEERKWRVMPREMMEDKENRKVVVKRIDELYSPRYVPIKSANNQSVPLCGTSGSVLESTTAKVTKNQSTSNLQRIITLTPLPSVQKINMPSSIRNQIQLNNNELANRKSIILNTKSLLRSTQNQNSNASPVGCSYQDLSTSTKVPILSQKVWMRKNSIVAPTGTQYMIEPGSSTIHNAGSSLSNGGKKVKPPPRKNKVNAVSYTSSGSKNISSSNNLALDNSVESFLKTDSVEKEMEILYHLDEESMASVVSKVMGAINKLYGGYFEQHLTLYFGRQKYEEIVKGNNTISEFSAIQHEDTSKRQPSKQNVASAALSKKNIKKEPKKVNSKRNSKAVPLLANRNKNRIDSTHESTIASIIEADEIIERRIARLRLLSMSESYSKDDINFIEPEYLKEVPDQIFESPGGRWEMRNKNQQDAAPVYDEIVNGAILKERTDHEALKVNALFQDTPKWEKNRSDKLDELEKNNEKITLEKPFINNLLQQNNGFLQEMSDNNVFQQNSVKELDEIINDLPTNDVSVEIVRPKTQISWQAPMEQIGDETSYKKIDNANLESINPINNNMPQETNEFETFTKEIALKQNNFIHKINSFDSTETVKDGNVTLNQNDNYYQKTIYDTSYGININTNHLLETVRDNNVSLNKNGINNGENKTKLFDQSPPKNQIKPKTSAKIERDVDYILIQEENNFNAPTEKLIENKMLYEIDENNLSHQIIQNKEKNPEQIQIQVENRQNDFFIIKSTENSPIIPKNKSINVAVNSKFDKQVANIVALSNLHFNSAHGQLDRISEKIDKSLIETDTLKIAQNQQLRRDVEKTDNCIAIYASTPKDDVSKLTEPVLEDDSATLFNLSITNTKKVTENVNKPFISNDTTIIKSSLKSSNEDALLTDNKLTSVFIEKDVANISELCKASVLNQKNELTDLSANNVSKKLINLKESPILVSNDYFENFAHQAISNEIQKADQHCNFETTTDVSAQQLKINDNSELALKRTNLVAKRHKSENKRKTFVKLKYGISGTARRMQVNYLRKISKLKVESILYSINNIQANCRHLKLRAQMLRQVSITTSDFSTLKMTYKRINIFYKFINKILLEKMAGQKNGQRAAKKKGNIFKRKTNYIERVGGIIDKIETKISEENGESKSSTTSDSKLPEFDPDENNLGSSPHRLDSKEELAADKTNTEERVHLYSFPKSCIKQICIYSYKEIPWKCINSTVKKVKTIVDAECGKAAQHAYEGRRLRSMSLESLKENDQTQVASINDQTLDKKTKSLTDLKNKTNDMSPLPKSGVKRKISCQEGHVNKKRRGSNSKIRRTYQLRNRFVGIEN